MGEVRDTNKPKLLLIAYRAFGDWIYSVPILPFLFEKYDVHLECNQKVHSLVYDDSRFSGITVFNDTAFVKKAMDDSGFDKDEAMKKHLQYVCDEVKPDRIINLSFSHENKTVASREQEEFFATQDERKEIFGKWDYYESVFDHVGLEKPDKLKLDTMYFSDEQMAYGERWRSRHLTDFLVVIPMLGSTMQKFYPYMDDVVYHIVNTYPNAHVYILGEKGIMSESYGHGRVHDLTGQLSIKQAILMTRYADYVIGPETGLVVAAGMWGTPKTMLCNTSGVHQVAAVHENDHSLQSNWKCSPCHKGIYTENDCDDVVYVGNIPYSACCNGFELNDIFNIIRTVYDQKNIYNRDYYERFAERANSEIGKKIYESRWELIEKYCHGKLTVLDYGCASGAFHKSSRNGFDAHGFDVNPYSEYKTLPDKKINILTMWDVIEHLNDPKATLERLDADWVFVSTPNRDAHIGDLKDWKHYREGEHLHHFNLDDIAGIFGDLGYKMVEYNFTEGALRDSEAPEQIITVVGKRVGSLESVN